MGSPPSVELFGDSGGKRAAVWRTEPASAAVLHLRRVEPTEKLNGSFIDPLALHDLDSGTGAGSREGTPTGAAR